MAIADEEIIRAARSLGVVGTDRLTAHGILASLCDPKLSAEQIAKVVERDPGIAARVLRVANSAFYGNPRQISTLDRALLLMGLDVVRTIAAAACLDRGQPRHTPQAPIDTRAITHHSLASAFAAEALARQCRRAEPSEAFMAALLHDFGIPVQERLDTEGIGKLLAALASDDETPQAVLEQSLVQVGHCDCARVIFQDWRLPVNIINAVVHHDSPARAPADDRDLAMLVHLGVQLALQAGYTHPLEPRPGPSARELMARSLGLEADAMDMVASGLAERVQLVVSNAA